MAECPTNIKLSPVEWVDCYLGHGRMLESALIFVKFQYFFMLMIVPQKDVLVIAFTDIRLPNSIMAIPFFTAGGLQLAGLILNILGHSISRWLRIIGAAIGMSIWVFLITKNIVLGFYATSTNPWFLMGIVGSVLIIRKAVLNLPIPGSQGAV